ncbi:hypothetical protein [Aeromicrobium sp. UC242_57]|uniref:hypothetical protein n=1 Tax=Aeromicrobium sp. UC242_57 TaxID=3374624 RepID=UPI0037A9014A
MTDTHAEDLHDDVPEVELTGHPQMDEALDRLQRLGELDIAAHPEEYDAIHGVLRESLANAGRDEVDVEPA